MYSRELSAFVRACVKEMEGSLSFFTNSGMALILTMNRLLSTGFIDWVAKSLTQ